MVEVYKVFVAGGLPSITYISRDEYQLESTIKDYLDERCKLLSISGSTKSGKTVLVRKIVPRESCFWVEGGQVKDVNSFWEIVLGLTGGYTSLSETRSENKNTSSGRVINASVKPAGVGGELTSQFSESEQHEASKTLGRTISSVSSAINQLLRHGLPLVVDDFHYIKPSVQQSIIRSLKSPIFDGLPVILITVPHREYDVIHGLQEMTARVKHLQIPTWQTSELEKIAELGFKELNVHCTPALIRKMEQESFNSPHLMQDFCKALCKENGISRTQSSLTQLQEPKDWDAFCRKMAPDTSKVAFDRLVMGPRSRTIRIKRTLVGGQQCEIYAAVLFAIASTGPKTKLTYEEIRAGLQTVLIDGVPQGNEVVRILEKMSELARDNIDGEPVVDWHSYHFHISDPFFAYYLKWGIILPKREERTLS